MKQLQREILWTCEEVSDEVAAAELLMATVQIMPCYKVGGFTDRLKQLLVAE